MKRSNRLVIYCSALSAVTALSGSCIKETGWDKCPSDLRIVFEYTHNSDGADRFTRDVNSVSLYFYDADGNNAFAQKYAVSEMENGNTVNINADLPDGNYTVVAWGNADESEFNLSGTGTLTGMRLDIKTNGNGEVSGNSIDLFHGIATFAYSKNANAARTISMIRNTNDVKLLISGLSTADQLTRASEYSFRIVGTNGSLAYDNSSSATSPTTYAPTYSDVTVDGTNYLQCAFKTMRIQTTSDLVINLSEDGTITQTDNIANLIMTNFPHISTDSDFDRYHDYTFVYDYKDSYTLVQIGVEDWTVVINSGGGI